MNKFLIFCDTINHQGVSHNVNINTSKNMKDMHSSMPAFRSKNKVHIVSTIFNISNKNRVFEVSSKEG